MINDSVFYHTEKFNNNRKITPKMAEQIQREYDEGIAVIELAKLYKVAPLTIYRHLKNIRYRRISQLFYYKDILEEELKKIEHKGRGQQILKLALEYQVDDQTLRNFLKQTFPDLYYSKFPKRRVKCFVKSIKIG